MACNFGSAGDVVGGSIGACGFAFGPGTVATILRRTTDGTVQVVVFIGNNAVGERHQFALLNDDTIQLRLTAGSVTSSTTVTSAMGWVLIAASKASGTATPRFHKYVYSTNAWTHEDGGGTEGNNGAPSGDAYVGNYVNFDAGMRGDIAVAGIWNVVLTDAQVESLAFTLAGWFAAAQPKGLWVLDQNSTAQNVMDLSGGGAILNARIGTSVSTSSVPVFNYGAGVS